MAKMITRTFETHHIYGAKVEVENGVVITHDLEPIEIFNQGVNQEKAIKLLQKVYGKKNQYIIGFSTRTHLKQVLLIYSNNPSKFHCLSRHFPIVGMFCLFSFFPFLNLHSLYCSRRPNHHAKMLFHY